MTQPIWRPLHKLYGNLNLKIIEIQFTPYNSSVRNIYIYIYIVRCILPADKPLLCALSDTFGQNYL